METEVCFLFIFLLVMAVVLGKGLTERVLFRISVRNVGRRKGNTVIVVLGLMIGTAIISSSLAIGDTMETMVEAEVLDYFHLEDEWVVAEGPSGQWEYFNQSLYGELAAGLQGYDKVDGLTPQVEETVSLLDITQQLFEPALTLRGVDFSTMDGFGSLTGTSGTKYTSLSSGDPALGIPGEILIGKHWAGELDATRGDFVQLMFRGRAMNFTVADVLEESGRASISQAVYVDISAAQAVADQPGRVNRILVSNDGGVEEGMVHTDAVIDKIDSLAISDGPLTLMVGAQKEEQLEESVEGVSMFTDLFLVFGTFTILAGAMLIVNIFVMLGEERKSEMGIMRAVGMRRHHLTWAFIYEGSMYAALSAFVGSIVGVAIGYGVIYAMEEIFSGFGGGGFALLQHFTYTPQAMAIAFTAGFLLTMATIAIASWRISKLNIVRAIREIPEPMPHKKDRRTAIVLGGIAVLGVLLTLMAMSVESAVFFNTGISLTILGGCLSLRWWTSERFAMNAAGIGILIFSYLPWDWLPDYGGGMEMFIVGGVLLVGGALLVILANSEQLASALNAFKGPGGKDRAVAKVAISYPNASKFRTGMTMGMFALIIFTIVTMNMMTATFNGNIDAQVEDMSGGYDIIGYANELPPEYIDAVMADPNSSVDAGMFDKVTVTMGGQVAFTGEDLLGNEQTVHNTLLGFDEDFLRSNDFELTEWADEYKDQDEVWAALASDNDTILIDTSMRPNEFGPPHGSIIIEFGDTLEIVGPDNRTHSKRVIGVLSSFLIRGIVGSESMVREDFGFENSTMVLFNVDDGEDEDDVGKELERSFLAFGMQTVVIKTMVAEQVKAMNMFFDLFQAYLALGLIVGLAGLGIITLRAVHERRQQIGMLRALGFTRRMVRRVFLLEAVFISFVGILVGTILGMSLGWMMWYYEFRPGGMDVFTIPWMDIVTLMFIALTATILCTVPPAHQASKVTPAEALRYE